MWLKSVILLKGVGGVLWPLIVSIPPGIQDFPLSHMAWFLKRIVCALIPLFQFSLELFQEAFALIPPKLCIKVTGEFHVAKSKAYFSVWILFYLPAGFNTVSSSLFLEALYLVSAHCPPNFVPTPVSTPPQLGPFLSHRFYNVGLSQGSVPWPLFCLLIHSPLVIFSSLYAFPFYTLMLPKFIWPAQSSPLSWACIVSCLLRVSTWRSDGHFNLKMSKLEPSHVTSSLIHFCISVMLILFFQFRPKTLGSSRAFSPHHQPMHTFWSSADHIGLSSKYIQNWDFSLELRHVHLVLSTASLT